MIWIIKIYYWYHNFISLYLCALKQLFCLPVINSFNGLGYNSNSGITYSQTVSPLVVVVSSVAQMGSSRAAEVNQLGADAIIEKPGGAVDPTLATQKGKEFIEIARKVLGV